MSNILPDAYPKNNSMKRVGLKLKNKVFEDLMIHYKKGDKKFIVYGILGSLTLRILIIATKNQKRYQKMLKNCFLI